jgi:hypothetical protein
MNETFGAPWGQELKVMTTLAFAIGLGIPLIGIFSMPAKFLAVRLFMIVVPLLLLVGCSLFAVRGYTLSQRELVIHRFGWATRFDLGAFISASFEPSALSGSIRLAGNGGLFAFCGLFRNRKLGNYRLFGTDLHCSVILKFTDKTIVVTPDAPEKFVAAIMRQK